MPSGEHPGMHIASLTEHRKFAFCDVALAADARITEINGRIGLMRRALRRWLVGQNWKAG